MRKATTIYDYVQGLLEQGKPYEEAIEHGSQRFGVPLAEARRLCDDYYRSTGRVRHASA
jgi:hypothetical protein